MIENEVKTAKDIQTGPKSQLAKDINAAVAGQRVNYVMTDNPVTGANQTNPATTRALNNANVATKGNLSWSHVNNIAPSASTINAVNISSHVSRGVRAFGRIAAPIGLAADVYSIRSAYVSDGNTIGINTKVAVAGSAGGWAGGAAGAWGGAKIGMAFGSFGGPAGTAIGAVVGGVLGAIGGAFFGSWGSESAASAVVN